MWWGKKDGAKTSSFAIIPRHDRHQHSGAILNIVACDRIPMTSESNVFNSPFCLFVLTVTVLWMVHVYASVWPRLITGQ